MQRLEIVKHASTTLLRMSSVTDMLRFRTANKLVILSLHGVDHITSGSLHILGKHCTHLKELNFSRCASLSPGGLNNLLSNLSGLTRLLLDRNDTIDSVWASLEAIAQSAESLRELTYYTKQFVDPRPFTARATDTPFDCFQKLTSLTTNIWCCMYAADVMPSLTHLSQHGRCCANWKVPNSARLSDNLQSFELAAKSEHEFVIAEGVNQMFSQWPKLTEFSGYNFEFADKKLEGFKCSIRLSHLAHISLTVYCESAAEQFLVYFSPFLPTLQSVEITLPEKECLTLPIDSAVADYARRGVKVEIHARQR